MAARSPSFEAQALARLGIIENEIKHHRDDFREFKRGIETRIEKLEFEKADRKEMKDNIGRLTEICEKFEQSLERLTKRIDRVYSWKLAVIAATLGAVFAAGIIADHAGLVALIAKLF